MVFDNKEIFPENIKHLVVEIICRGGFYLDKEKVAKRITYYIAEKTNSEVLSENTYWFPNGSYTYLAVLSSSHVAISTYLTRDGDTFIDVDAVWCSGVDLNLEEFEEFIKEIIGKEYFVSVGYKKFGRAIAEA